MRITMKKDWVLMPLFLMACSQQATISKDTLKDKIAGGWAGKNDRGILRTPYRIQSIGQDV